jgi:hypothetical protein
MFNSFLGMSSGGGSGGGGDTLPTAENRCREAAANFATHRQRPSHKRKGKGNKAFSYRRRWVFPSPRPPRWSGVE